MSLLSRKSHDFQEANDGSLEKDKDSYPAQQATVENARNQMWASIFRCRQLRILTVFYFIRRFVVLLQIIPRSCTACGDGLFSNVSCVGNEDEYFLLTSDKSLGVFSSIDTFLTILHLFSTTTMSMIFVSIRSCAEIHFGLIVVSLPTIQQTDHPIVVVESQQSGLSSAHRRWKPLLRYAGM